MWGYNYDYLSHANHKYIDKYRGKKGMWVYVYEKNQNTKKGQAARDRNIGSQLDSRMKSYNDISNKRAAIEQESVKKYQYKKRLEAARKAAQGESSSKGKVKAAIDQQMKSTLDPNRRSAQNSREAAIQESARKTQEKNRQDQLAKAVSQAEREHSSKSAAIDSRRDRDKEISKVVQSIRQQNAAKQAEAERKAAGYDTRERQKVSAKQAEKERQHAGRLSPEYSREKEISKSVDTTWKQKANDKIKSEKDYNKYKDLLKSRSRLFAGKYREYLKKNGNKDRREQLDWTMRQAPEIKSLITMLEKSDYYKDDIYDADVDYAIRLINQIEKNKTGKLSKSYT